MAQVFLNLPTGHIPANCIGAFGAKFDKILEVILNFSVPTGTIYPGMTHMTEYPEVFSEVVRLRLSAANSFSLIQQGSKPSQFSFSCKLFISTLQNY